MSNRRNIRQPANGESRQDAHAPYNFTPLPEKIVTVFDQPGIALNDYDAALPSHNRFDPDRRHGYFDIILTTESPLYIRGPLTRKEAENKEANRNKPDFFHTGDPNLPVIPGSSLRGMIRALVEIITWGKLTRLTQRQLFYRTVDDSALGKEYSRRMTGKVEAGFLQRNGSDYVIRKTVMLRVDRRLLVADTQNPIELYEGDRQNWTPRWDRGAKSKWYQYAPVWVTSTDGKNVDDISPVEQHADGWYAGILVITGNMPGIDRRTNKPKKQREFVFLLPTEDAESIKVPTKMLERFHDDDQITQWQEKAFPVNRPRKASRKRMGMLVDQPGDYENPLFFLRENNELVFFGRAGMFRLPYRNSPMTLLPEKLRDPSILDFAEAMFGFIQHSKGDQGKQGDKQRAYAGRVSVTDARLVTETDDPYEPEITPPILASPKPTAFQHYLEQPNTPNPKQFIHYDSANARLRGHKLYWRQQMSSERYRASHQADVKADSTQHTRLKAVKPGMQFSFRVDFENLTDVELGALAWVLMLGSDSHLPAARHMLGMGKPLGMGVVKLETKLFIRDRRQYYAALFDETGWARADIRSDETQFIKAFESFMKEALKLNAEFTSHVRMQALVAMLTLRKVESLNKEMFSHMSLDKRRSVLRSPLAIAAEYDAAVKAEEDRIRQEEEEKRKAEKRLIGIERGDEISGEVFDVSDGIWFTPDAEFTNDKEYEAYIPNVLKRRNEGERVKARVLEVKPGDPILLICEQIVDNKRK